jgi:hypothetical protein
VYLPVEKASRFWAPKVAKPLLASLRVWRRLRADLPLGEAAGSRTGPSAGHLPLRAVPE